MHKSKIRQLDALVAALATNSPTPDPKRGCFCLAREHPLSQYTPSCPSCAFILCALNLPYHLCPSCSSPLLASPADLIADLKSKITQTLQDEERERQRRVEEAKRAAGAFPHLSTITPKKNTAPSHKILSIPPSSGKQKIKITSISRTPSRPSTPLEYRVPPPPSTIDHPRGKVDPNRPWKNFLLGEDVIYVPG